MSYSLWGFVGSFPWKFDTQNVGHNVDIQKTKAGSDFQLVHIYTSTIQNSSALTHDAIGLIDLGEHLLAQRALDISRCELLLQVGELHL